MNSFFRHPALRIILYSVLFLAYSYTSVDKSWDDDFRAYYQAGDVILSGQDIYDKAIVEGNYLYSPFFALLMSTLAMMSPIVAAAFWFAGAMASLVLTLLMALYLNENPEISFLPWMRGFVSGRARRPGSGRVLFLTVILSARFWLNSIEHGQINLQLWGLALAALYFLHRRRLWEGSFILGVVVTTKIIPGLFVFYCLLKKQYRFAAYSMGWIFLLLLAPAIFLGWEQNLALHRAWFDKTVLAGLVEGAIDFGDANQSLPAMLARFLFDIPANSDTGATVNFLSLPLHSIGLVVKTCTGLLAGLLTLWTFRPVWKSGSGNIILRQNLELSLVFITASLMPALAWKAFFVASIMGYTTVLFAMANQELDLPRKLLTFLVWGSFVLHTVTTDGLWGWPLAHIFQSYSCATFSMILLYIAVVIVLFRASKTSSKSSPLQGN